MSHRYRKKPVVIEARQFVVEDAIAVYQWVEANTQGSFDPQSDELPGSGVSIDPESGILLIATPEGGMVFAKLGDWIVRDPTGCFSSCRDDVFRETYEAIP